jgi:hypothetical protein
VYRNQPFASVRLYVIFINQSECLRRLGQAATISYKLSARGERGSLGDAEKPVDDDLPSIGLATCRSATTTHVAWADRRSGGKH